MQEFIITFRETFEVALIAGIVLSFLNRTNQSQYNIVVYAGIAAAVLVSMLLAYISEMITNSIKHAFEGVDSPELQVLLVNSEGYFEVTVQDNGIGLPEKFNLQSPLSLGTEIILALSDQINARLEHFNDNGAKFNIRFQEQPFSN